MRTHRQLNVKALLMTAATAATVIATGGAGAASAQAAPAVPARPALTGQPCYGSSCVGRNPNSSNSNGNCVQGAYNPYSGTWAESAYDVTTLTVDGNAGGGSLTLRYSPYCAANWARWNGGGNSGLDYWVETSDGTTAGGYSGNRPNYTTMVDGTQLARVCYDNRAAYVSGCSGWH